MCVYVYIYVYISLSPKTVRVTCIDLVVLIVTCSSLRVSQRLLILIMKNHGRCVNISKDHLKHSGRNFNYGHSTVLCTCIHVILNKDVHQKKKSCIYYLHKWRCLAGADPGILEGEGGGCTPMRTPKARKKWAVLLCAEGAQK